MIPRAIVSLSLAACIISPGAAAEEALPFFLPVPAGWRTETIPFPLEFAPDLPYTGLEELRFAPGMFQEDSEEYFTYAFVWWVEPDAPNDAASLALHLETYFRGLMASVAQSRKISIDDAKFSATLQGNAENGFQGVAETFDAFVTAGQTRLHVQIYIKPCPAQDRQAIFFALSPQSPDHAVWGLLRSIREGFRCEEVSNKT